MHIPRIKKRLLDEYLAIRGFAKSIQNKNRIHTMTEPIDIVVTWVDGNDPAWRAEKAEYDKVGTNSTPQGNGACRYRDWSFFRYWFRAIEQYAPWVNMVYFVTWGHVPEWLNVHSPKLKVVRHVDFIPSEYLPTFNCNPIEFNLHRIPGLSEHFIYFNDDVFLARYCRPTDFFVDNQPVCCPVPSPFRPYAQQVSYHMFFGTYCIANELNDVAASIRSHPELWFSYVNRKHFQYIKRAYRESVIEGGFHYHMGVPLRKSVMEQAWNKYPCIAETCTHKFRTPMDAVVLLYTIEHLMTGNFYPVKPNHFGTLVNMYDFDQIRSLFENKSSRMVCFTDSNEYTDEDENRINSKLGEMFEKIFPNKSAFEK